VVGSPEGRRHHLAFRHRPGILSEALGKLGWRSVGGGSGGRSLTLSRGLGEKTLEGRPKRPLSTPKGVSACGEGAVSPRPLGECRREPRAQTQKRVSYCPCCRLPTTPPRYHYKLGRMQLIKFPDHSNFASQSFLILGYRQACYVLYEVLRELRRSGEAG